MALTIYITKDKQYDPEKVKIFWTPFKLKFKDRPQFKFKEVDAAGDKENAVVLPWHLVPTYKGMLHIENLESTSNNPTFFFKDENVEDLLVYDIREFT